MKEAVSLRLESETLNRLNLLAQATGCQPGSLMVDAIERYVAHGDWQVAAIQDAVSELESGHARIVEHEEVERWLRSWGASVELEPPSCG
ncbi:CopG family ribbon-helix-helix protein [Thiorhodovibrio frisius]|uniref:Putative transcriptional regulator n=1 Tax=Thiorhodovibrio frisius TaxID=631362 RepID=H8YZB8_9GAMM|nr:putative transcriptional regulator [Thiorhodovibrio frisius]EIC22045.1 putative transcriptional regulator [Thiorhodovibrio frisius]WPL24336.1 hypothetical protein Thiofri_04553 [Thiorhodovibrio frisius]